MKKAPLPATSRAGTSASTLWRNLALIMGASTIALAILLVRVSNALDALAASTVPQPPAATALPGALAPYAALGSSIAEDHHIANLGWSAAQFDAFVAGMRSSYQGQRVPMNDEAERLRSELERRIHSGHGPRDDAPAGGLTPHAQEPAP